MMIIADSGSTKTDWRLVDKKGLVSIQKTSGLNPAVNDVTYIEKEIKHTFSEQADNQKVEKVFYYGAGCWNESACGIVKKAINKVFPNSAITVESDLLGAARALCGHQEGIACILGTGANSCHFDGHQVLDQIPALGYIIGDEGSGADLGKRLLSAYFYRELSLPIAEKLKSRYALSKAQLLDHVYKKSNANSYLASFVPFILQEKTDPVIRQIIYTSLNTFVERQLLKYQGIKKLPVHFVGSVAYLLQNELLSILDKHQLLSGKILQKPIDGLIVYHNQY